MSDAVLNIVEKPQFDAGKQIRYLPSVISDVPAKEFKHWEIATEPGYMAIEQALRAAGIFLESDAGIFFYEHDKERLGMVFCAGIGKAPDKAQIKAFAAALNQALQNDVISDPVVYTHGELQAGYNKNDVIITNLPKSVLRIGEFEKATLNYLVRQNLEDLSTFAGRVSTKLRPESALGDVKFRPDDVCYTNEIVPQSRSGGRG